MGGAIQIELRNTRAMVGLRAFSGLMKKPSASPNFDITLFTLTGAAKVDCKYVDVKQELGKCSVKKVGSMLMLAVALAACGNGKETPKTPSVHQQIAPAAPVPPAAPSGISTLSGDGTVTIKWAAVNGVDSYNVYFSQKAGSSTEEATKISGIKETSYAQKDLKNSTIYYYRVSAVSSVGEGDLSAETGAMPKSAPPPVPSGVAAMGGMGKIAVKWEPVKGADSYNVYFSTTPQLDKSKRKMISGVKQPSYEHTDVKKKTMYFYMVSAVNGGGESPLSTESGAMP